MPEISTAPRERPILFRGPMVRAILDGRKMVTRRVVQRQPADGWDFASGYGRITSNHRHKGKFGAFIRRGVGTDFPELDIIPCPYGMPGDRLWVREAWAETYVAQAPGDMWVVYREGDNRTDYGGPWKPSIHMRRRDSRILLEITAVRVERLHEISEEQAAAEGIQKAWQYPDTYLTPAGDFACAKVAFQRLWESINGPESWNANPWVWVVEFRRVTP